MCYDAHCAGAGRFLDLMAKLLGVWWLNAVNSIFVQLNA